MAFRDTLVTIDQGLYIIDVEKRFQELVQAVRETGEAGRMTLQVLVKPANKGDGSVIMLEAKATTKKPEQGSAKAIFFTTDDGELVRNDPRQTNMFEPRAGARVIDTQAEE